MTVMRLMPRHCIGRHKYRKDKITTMEYYSKKNVYHPPAFFNEQKNK